MNPSIQHKKCIFVNDKGQRCNSFKMRNNEFCYLHNPSIPNLEKQRIRKKGGKAKLLVVKTGEAHTDIKLNTPKRVAEFYSLLINSVMGGKMDLRVASGLAYVCSGLLKALELCDIEQRLEKIETKLTQTKHITYEQN